MCSKQVGLHVSFKLNMTRCAKLHDNQVGKRHFGPCPTKKVICDGRRQSRSRRRTNVFCTCTVKWANQEAEVKNWMMDQNFFVYKNDLLCSEKMGSCMLRHWLWLDSSLVLQIHEEACTNYMFWNYSNAEYTSWIQKKIFQFQKFVIAARKKSCFVNLSLKCE